MSLDFLLDSNVVSALVRSPLGKLRQRLERVGSERTGVSVVVAAEVRYGLAKRAAQRLTQRVEDLFATLQVVGLEPPADRIYGELRAELERRGQLIGPNDLLIAAHALALDCTLVTDNEREFSRVEGLRIENWLRG